MMMALGMFIFSLDTAAYQELDRQTEWRHVSNPRVGARDAFQFTGDGDDTITLTGWIAPELTGSAFSLDAVRAMADTGKAWILIKGTGRVYGTFLITSLNEKHSILGADGDPARLDFTITLKRKDEGLLSLLGDLGDITSVSQVADMAGLGNLSANVQDAIGKVTDIAGKFL